MSLIHDALKAAQRERSEGDPVRSVAPTFETVLPYSSHERQARSPRAVLLAGGIIAAVLVAAAMVVIGSRGAESEKPVATLATQTNIAPVLPAPSSVVVAPPPVVTIGSSSPTAKGDSAIAPPRVVSVAASSPASPTSTVSAPPVRETRSTAASTLAEKPASTVAAPANTAPRQQTAAANRPATASRDSVRVPVTTVQASPSVSPAPARAGSTPVRMRPADSLSRLAYEQHMKNNLDAAHDLYEKAIATKQASAEAFNNYGVLLQQQGNRAMSIEMFRQAIARDETNVEAWVNLGDSFIAAGHHSSALSAFDRARQLDPSRAAIKTRLANEYLATGDTTSARRSHEDAVRVSPGDARAHYAFGTFLVLVKDYAAAIRELDLFVKHAEKTPGEFTPEKIAEVKQYVASLRRSTP